MNFLRSYLRIMEITILLDSQLHRGVEADGKHSLIWLINCPIMESTTSTSDARIAATATLALICSGLTRV